MPQDGRERARLTVTALYTTVDLGGPPVRGSWSGWRT
jgi:hypothetical protein